MSPNSEVNREVIQKSTTLSQPPKVPVMRLRYGGKVYNGLPGSGCWPQVEPDGSVNTLCWDTDFLEPSVVIPIAARDVLTLEVEAYEPPTTLSALAFPSIDQSPIQIALTPSLTVPFTFNLPVGVYIIHVFGGWPEGSVYRAFKIEVN